MNYDPDFLNDSIFRVCSPSGNICITLPSNKLINDSDQAEHRLAGHHLWISIGRRISIVNGHSLSGGNLIRSRRIYNYSLMSNGLFLMRWDVVNIRTLLHLKICRIIWGISRKPLIDILEPSRPNGLIPINPWFDHTFLVWANGMLDSYVLME